MIGLVGMRIRALRNANGLSLKECSAAIVGRGNVVLGENYLGKIERGVARAPLDTLEAIAKFFEVPLAELVDVRRDLSVRLLPEKSKKKSQRKNQK